MKKPTMLIILDGLGLNENQADNAVQAAQTPTIDWLRENVPSSTLSASGRSVGLLDGQMGDSNVGHLNIGAGRIVYQDVVRITKSIEDGDFFENEVLLQAVNHSKKTGGALHLMGLVSPGGVHSHSEHLYALLRFAKAQGLERVYIHAFLDGRDVPPAVPRIIWPIWKRKLKRWSGQDRLHFRPLLRHGPRSTLGSGEKAYRALMGVGRTAPDSATAITEAYAKGETDEFVIPIVITENGEPVVRCRMATVFSSLTSGQTGHGDYLGLCERRFRWLRAGQRSRCLLRHDDPVR